MTLGLWILRPAYLGTRLTLPTGYNAPRAVEAVGAIAYIAPSAATNVVARVDTSTDPFTQTHTSAALSGPVRALAAAPALVPPVIFAATDQTPAVVYKLNAATLATIGSPATLAAGEGPILRMAVGGALIHATIGTSPGRLVALDVGTAGVGPARSYALTLGAGENTPRGLALNPASDLAFVGASNGAVIRIYANPVGPAYARQASVTLPLPNASALAFGLGYDGLLYAGAGGGVGAPAAAYQLDPATMTVRASVGAPYPLDGFPFTDMAFDTTSLSPGRFVYAMAAGTPGELYQFTTGADGDGFSLSRRFGLDTFYNLDADSQMAFVGTGSPLTPSYLYFGQYLNPGILVRFDTAALGLVLRPRYGWTYDRPSREAVYAPVGADKMTIRTMGVGGRSGPMTHLIRSLNSDDAMYLRGQEDEATIAACRPFGYLRDPSPAAYALTRAVAITDLRMTWNQAAKGRQIELAWRMREIH